MGYNREQVHDILSTSGSFRLFHHTALSNLDSIIAERNIYSLATLWGLKPSTRTTVPGNSAQISASIGFIDYVYLSKVNRLVSGLNTIFGHLCFQIHPEILLDKESFVYPFNTGFDWQKPHTSRRKKSDATTLERCIVSNFVTDEFLVRRKISIEYIEAVYCFDKDFNEVQRKMMQNGWNIDIRKVSKANLSTDGKVIPIKSFERPNYDATIWVPNGQKTFTRDRLFVNSVNDNLIAFDDETNCIAEFRMDGDNLVDPFEGEIQLGVLGKVQNQAQSS